MALDTGITFDRRIDSLTITQTITLPYGCAIFSRLKWLYFAQSLFVSPFKFSLHSSPRLNVIIRANHPVVISHRRVTLITPTVRCISFLINQEANEKYPDRPQTNIKETTSFYDRPEATVVEFLRNHVVQLNLIIVVVLWFPSFSEQNGIRLIDKWNSFARKERANGN